MINVNPRPTLKAVSRPQNPYEMRDLGDGRVGIFYNGLCKGVVRSKEEAVEWFSARNVKPPDPEQQSQMLSRALTRT